MKIAVPIKFVPDLVEELTIDPNGTALDTSWLRLIINEFDDHAVEQAILLKERGGGEVTVVAAEAEGVDDFLYTAAAKGADHLIKLTGDFGSGMNSHAAARALADLLKDSKPDLILTGVQAHNDLDGAVGPLLAELLDMPYVGYVAGVSSTNDKAIARKEYPGGIIAEMEIKLPAVLGIQAAEQPPRYVAYNRIRQVMGTSKIEERTITALDLSGGVTASRMFQPESSQRATILEGSPEEVADQMVGILKELGML
ncbi:MAG: electron transfer flavoprotein subunit beta/FixA family protein [Chloroflexi bacterium]|nr:electron transfer flavoprotein subunit beta/FixA family protein [Chloroflexota bacterium]